MVKVFNAFSLQMLQDMNATVTFRVIDADEVKKLMLIDGSQSFIGHKDTCEIVSNLLGVEVPYNRAFGKISRGDTAIIAQVTGGRLPEGAIELPPEMKLNFVQVDIK